MANREKYFTKFYFEGVDDGDLQKRINVILDRQ